MAMRQASNAGSFYPGNRVEIEMALNDFFNSVRKDIKPKGKIKAIIVPHAGYSFSGPVAAAVYKLVKAKFSRVILLGPSHFVNIDFPYSDECESWVNPIGNINLDTKMEKKLELRRSATVHRQEHSLEVQIPFLQKFLGRFSIVPILVNYYNEKLAEKIKENLDSETLIVVSSDFSHYLVYDEAVAVDKNSIRMIMKLDFKGFDEKGDACGSAGILTLMRIAKDLKWKPVLVDYKNSGDILGDKRRVVGYAGIIFTG